MKLFLILPAIGTYPFRPVNLALLSAVARDQGWETRLFDPAPHLPDETIPESNPNKTGGTSGLTEKILAALACAVRKEVQDYAPDLVAMTVISDNRFTAATITRLIRESDSSVPVLWGGVEPTINPDRALTEFGADLVCRGEGVGAFRDVLQALTEGSPCHDIPNIWSRHADGIIANPVRPLIEDLDTLPFLDLTIFPYFSGPDSRENRPYVNADHMISWGCPQNCSYCINAFYHALYAGQYRIRHYSPERIIAELEWFKNTYGITYFHFHDEDFLQKSDMYLSRLASLYSSRVNLPFSIMASPGSVTQSNVELLKEMKCSTVAFGIETGDLSIRSAILSRKDSADDIHRAVALFNHAGIRTSSFNMLALPFYSRESYEKTIRLNRDAGITAAYASFFYPYEGTRIREIAIRHGFFDPEDPGTAINHIAEPALHFPGISQDELIAMREVFSLYCLLPEEYYPYIRRAEIDDRTGCLLRSALVRIPGRSGIPATDRGDGEGSADLRNLDEILNRPERG